MHRVVALGITALALSPPLLAASPAFARNSAKVAASSAPPAVASPPGEIERQAAARALFEEGLRHADAGRWGEAADRFERAYALRPTPEIAYNWATALGRLGRLVRASELLRQVERDPQAPAGVRRAAGARLAKLRPRIGRLTVRVEGAAAGAPVLLDGRPLDAALVGVAFPIDPGLHSLEARPRKGGAVTRVAMVGEGAEVMLTLDPILAPAGGERAGSGRGSVIGSPWLWTILGVAVVGAGVAVGLSRDGSSSVRGNVDTWHLGLR
jgi:predicted transcriptional regulator